MTSTLTADFHDITACLLAGGEGRRMGGQDKGLIPYQGRPLAAWVLSSLTPQCASVMVVANRNAAQYEALLGAHQHHPATQAATPQVMPDDPDLPAYSGPLAGILTALRHCPTDWLLVAPCDVPHLPADLGARLMAQARLSHADIVVPATQEADGQTHFHWVCALIHKRVCPHTERMFVNGDRKIGSWVRAFTWASVFFPEELAFTNMNTPETWHGRG
ncbi:MAG: molybdenum cofactor guanylyltransferase MobA [Aquabacterium sp.]